MRSRFFTKLMAFTAITLLAVTVRAQTLKVGSTAPKLQVAKWVQGDAVKEFEAGKVYVVEFWATWCGPCKATIPHLNELHQKLKDKGVVFIGQDVWEKDESKVAPFVKSMGDKMTYRITLDDKTKDKEGAMSTTWMRAAGRNGIPSAFIVDKKGKIAWIDHPAKMTAKLLEAIAADNYDPKKDYSEASPEAAPAKTGALGVGDAAPKLAMAKFVQGEPVASFEAGKAYVVEFWATWCGPCKATIPHLNELHQKFKDKGLVVIGQDVWEKDDAKVEPFVKSMGDKMTYRVAVDDKSKDTKGAMATTWMTAAEQNGIPAAFLVDKQGKIAWVGHPGTLNDVMLEDLLAGRTIAGATPAKAKAKEPAKPRPIASTKNHEIMTLTLKLSTSLRDKDWAAAEEAVTKLEKLAPDAPQYSLQRFQILVAKQDYDGANKFLADLSAKHPDDAKLQNDIAWLIAGTPELSVRDLVLAEKAATRANEIAQGKDVNILDTLARIQFMSGRQAEAVATMQKALADSKGNGGLAQTLASYRAGKLPAGQ